MTEPTFTKEQVREIADRFAAAIPNVIPPRDLYEKGWLVSRFALAQIERAEKTEKERDEAEDAINDAHALLLASTTIQSMFKRWQLQPAVRRARERGKVGA